MTATEGPIRKRPDLFALLVAWSFTAASLWSIGIVAAAVFAYPFSPGYEGGSVETGDVFGMIVGTLSLVACAALAVASGVGLVRRRRWGWTTAVANAVLSLLLVPPGVVAGPLALAYLLRPDVREYSSDIP